MMHLVTIFFVAPPRFLPVLLGKNGCRDVTQPVRPRGRAGGADSKNRGAAGASATPKAKVCCSAFETVVVVPVRTAVGVTVRERLSRSVLVVSRVERRERKREREGFGCAIDQAHVRDQGRPQGQNFSTSKEVWL